MGKILKRFPIGLKTVNVQTMNMGMNHRLFFCFIVGILIGTVLLNFFAGAYADKMGIYSEYAMGDIGSLTTEGFSKWSFFTYCIRKYVIEIIIILIISCTSIWKVFDCIYCAYKGMAISILVSSATATYGAGGLLLYIMSIFPHYLVYVPLVIFTLYFGMKIKEKIKSDKLILLILKGIVIEGIIITMTSFLEAYVNYPFIREMFK